MSTPDLPGVTWRKSSRSGSDEGECVEIASVDRFVAVRDSKDPSGPVLPLTPTAWRGLLDRLKTEH